MKTFFKVTVNEWKLNYRNFYNIFFSLVFPIMMLVLFGSIYGNEPSDFLNGYGNVDYSVPGYICMVIAVGGLMTLPITMSTYRDNKILKRFMATPMKPIDILFSQLIVNAITTIVGLILLVIFGKIIFDLHFFGSVGITILAFLLVLVSQFSIGLFIASVAPNSKASNIIANIIYFPMLFLSGATLPLEIMPKTVANISKIFPLTYGVNLLKGVWLGGNLSDFTLEIIILAVITVVLGGLSLALFKWD